MAMHYLSTPYAKHPEGVQVAYQQALDALAILVQAGYHVYSPIIHNHPLGLRSEFKGFDWLKEDAAFMERFDCMILYKMPSWESSIGIAFEQGYFRAKELPVYEMNFPLNSSANIRWKEMERYTHHKAE